MMGGQPLLSHLTNTFRGPTSPNPPSGACRNLAQHLLTFTITREIKLDLPLPSQLRYNQSPASEACYFPCPTINIPAVTAPRRALLPTEATTRRLRATVLTQVNRTVRRAVNTSRRIVRTSSINTRDTPLRDRRQGTDTRPATVPRHRRQGMDTRPATACRHFPSRGTGGLEVTGRRLLRHTPRRRPLWAMDRPKSSTGTQARMHRP